MDKSLIMLFILMVYSTFLTFAVRDSGYERGFKAGKKVGIKQERARIAEQKEAYPEMFEVDTDDEDKME